MVAVANYLDEKNIVFLDVESREEALKQLVDTLFSHNQIGDRDAFFSAVCEREDIVSTGIGMGVAIPHAKLSTYNEFFIGVGILKKGVDWDSIDEAPVRLIFLIGGPDDKQTEYLRILSNLTQVVKNEEDRNHLINAHSAEEVVKILCKD